MKRIKEFNFAEFKRAAAHNIFRIVVAFLTLGTFVMFAGFVTTAFSTNASVIRVGDIMVIAGSLIAALSSLLTFIFVIRSKTFMKKIRNYHEIDVQAREAYKRAIKEQKQSVKKAKATTKVATAKDENAKLG